MFLANFVESIKIGDDSRLRDFLVEKGLREVSLRVYDPNRGRLNPRELYANLQVVFAETEIMVHLHKKYYLSIA